MSSAAMSFAHHSSAAGGAAPQAAPEAGPWAWALPAGRAQVLPDAAGARWLAVHQGRVWLTAMHPLRQAEDIWLQAGERQLLPPGSAWLMEGWPHAQVSLLLAAPQ